MTEPRRLRAFLVDPSLFTAPYDAALTRGLVEAGVQPTWAARPARSDDRQEIPTEYLDAFFYRRSDRFASGALRSVVKGVAHAVGLIRLSARVASRAPHVVHFQWLVVPLLDSIAIRILGRTRPVILTVHDTVPFNGAAPNRWQKLGHDLPLKLVDRVIVHTRSGREALIRRGVAEHKIAVIPHGALGLGTARPRVDRRTTTDDRRTFVLFGELKHYKGADLLVEAVGLLPPSLRRRARFVIAGRPRMDLAPVIARIDELGLNDVIELRPRRLSDDEVADLLAEADCFVFPYRQVDASGVYFLVKGLQKWIIASNVGVFAEEIAPGTHGELVPAADAAALSAALARAIAEPAEPGAARPDTSWSSIGARTSELYRDALRTRGAA
jgi:glycosyltransferase involved in cell wall biosynthesis